MPGTGLSEEDESGSEIVNLSKGDKMSELQKLQEVTASLREKLDAANLQVQELQKCNDSYHTTKGCCRALAAHQHKTEKPKGHTAQGCDLPTCAICRAEVGEKRIEPVQKAEKKEVCRHCKAGDHGLCLGRSIDGGCACWDAR